MSIRLGLLFACLPIWFSEAQTPSDGEWQVRRWALKTETHQTEIENSLSSEDWRDRSQALEALLRSEVEIAKSSVWACLDFDHPSVTASALNLLAKWGDAGSLTDERAMALEQARIPEVRAAFAKWICSTDYRKSPLAVLSFDVDEVVRFEARVALFSMGTSETASSVLNKLALEGELTEFVEALVLCKRTSVVRGEAFEFELTHGALSHGRRALVAAMKLSNGWGSAADLNDLLLGWFSAESKAPEARAFLNSCASGIDQDLADGIVEFCTAIDRGDSEKWTLAIKDCEQLGEDVLTRREDLFEAGADVIGIIPFVNRMSAMSLSDDAFLSLANLAFRRLEDWGRGFAESCFARENGQIKALAVAALSQGAIAGYSYSTEFFGEELQRGSLREREVAFRNLCLADDYEAWLIALFEEWQTHETEQRLLLLNEMPRTVAPIPFRAALIELGQNGGASRAAVLDLLGLFKGDSEVALLFAEWVSEETELLEDADEAIATQAELRATGALRGLAFTATVEQAELVNSTADQMLDETGGFSKRIGKVAIEWLGQTADSAKALEGHMGADTLLENRIESALVLAKLGEPDSAKLLIELLPEAPTDLVDRMFPAIWSHPRPATLAWLRETAQNESVSSSWRNHAAEQLAWGQLDESVLDALAHIARHAPDVETMVIALGGLGRAKQAGAKRLLAIRAEVEAQADNRIAKLTDDYREWVRSELLLALVLTESFPKQLLSSVLERPSQSASAWYRRRLSGEQTSRAEFEWRGELALVSEFAKQALIGELLGATEAWWRLDGRLLIKMGFAVAKVAPSENETVLASELFRAGQIALRGEASLDHEADVRAQSALISMANSAQQRGRAARYVGALVSDWRASRIPARVWNTVIGERDRSRGQDLASRYAALEFQLRSQAALVRGDLELAQELANEANRRVGYSSQAQTTQSELEAQIAKSN